jgi:two-component system, NtrC family, response regulator HydG
MSEKAFVLIVEPNADDGDAICASLARSGHACKVVTDAPGAIESVKQRPPDVVVTAHPLTNGLDGLDVLRETKAIAPDAEVILLPGDGADESAREAVNASGPRRAFDCLVKPIDVDALRRSVDRAARQAVTERQNRIMRQQLGEAYNFEGLIGSSELLAREIKRVRKLAPTKSTILIFGETGTGKELVARAIHNNSPRAAKPFQAINVAALTESLAESELFGHTKGAFTGALADRKGLIESAHGGTLFLDEIGDMSLPLQAKILRTLENGEIMRVGSNDIRRVDVRFVAATHHDLAARVEQEKFREDLFYRLHAQGAIRLPPLRERREDIPLLVQHFIDLANRENDTDIQGVGPEAIRKLTNYGWRGNVRELRHVVERMVVEAEGELITVEDLPEHISGSTDIVPLGGPSLAGLSMADVERLHILNTLKMTGGNRERAASVLKIGARTLYRKLKDYGIT